MNFATSSQIWYSGKRNVDFLHKFYLVVSPHFGLNIPFASVKN